MKRMFGFALAALAAAGLFAGCGSSGPAPASEALSSEAPASAAPSASSEEAAAFDPSMPITVVSREPGSGTRGAFIELFGIEEKDAAGNKVDHTTQEAVVVSQTNVVMTTVASDEYAIGYISLGSLNDTVKALKVDGAEPTAANVASGAYQVSRPFNIATKGEPAGLAKDFISYIMSAEGQRVIGENGYIKVDAAAAAFAGEKPEGKLVVAGSSSVSPVMEKLIEAYQALNPAASIELQTSDSSAGMTAAMEGVCDIGMASRALKEEESAALVGLPIANDGIAMIVSPQNPLDDISGANVKAVFTGEVTSWDGLR